MAELALEAPQVMRRGATYAWDGTLRLTLTREWGPGPTVCYLGHNPSTANHEKDDPTSLAWVHFAKLWGAGRYVAANLTPYRSPTPAEAREWTNWAPRRDWAVRDALMLNHSIVLAEAKKADIVVACWGAIATGDMAHLAEYTVEEIQQNEAPWPDIYCLGTTNDGSPKHPMARGKHRIARDQRFVLWRPSDGNTVCKSEGA